MEEKCYVSLLGRSQCKFEIRKQWERKMKIDVRLKNDGYFKVLRKTDIYDKFVKFFTWMLASDSFGMWDALECASWTACLGWIMQATVTPHVLFSLCWPRCSSAQLIFLFLFMLTELPWNELPRQWTIRIQKCLRKNLPILSRIHFQPDAKVPYDGVW